MATTVLAIRFGKLVKAHFLNSRILTSVLNALHLGLDLTPRRVIDVTVSARVPKVFVGVVTDIACLIERQAWIVFLDIIGGYGEEYVIDIDAEDVESLHQVIRVVGRCPAIVQGLVQRGSQVIKRIDFQVLGHGYRPSS